MAKTPSLKLFHLVKSLTGSEKRYFKIFINSKDPANNKYVRLFDAIEAQPEFDEAQLMKSVYGDEPVETRKYSELKAYLHDLILKSLQFYDENSSVDYRVKNLLMDVRTAFKRSWFDDAKDLLRKAKRVAEKYEDFNALLEILNWEKRIAYAQMDIPFLDRELERIMQEEHTCLENLQNISAYRSIFFKILVSIRKDVSRREQQVQALRSLMEDPLLQDEKQAGSFTAKVLYHRIYTIFHFSTSDFEAFYKSSKTLLKLMESNPAMLGEDVSEYISALSNHVVSCGRLEKIEEVRATLDKLIKVKPINLDDEVKIHQQYYNNKFRLCIATGEFEEGKKELQKHLETIEKFDRQHFSKSEFYFQYFYLNFGAGDFEKALDCLNDWLKLPDTVERKDLQSLARILNLIIHFELGNTVLLDSLLRSTQRYLRKEDRLSAFEQKMMQFIREAGKPHSKKEKRAALETLKLDFERLPKSPSFGMFDLISWLESKISGKPFAAVVRDAFRKKAGVSA